MAGRRVPKSIGPRWRLPFTEDQAWPITQPYGYDPAYTGNSQGFHYGIDFGCPPGTLIVAVTDGQVVVANNEEPQGYPGVLDGAWGTYVEIDHGDGLHSGYCHLQGLLVYPSQQVRAGQGIGLSGQTGLPGYITGPHLHLQGLLNGRRVDPGLYLM